MRGRVRVLCLAAVLVMSLVLVPVAMAGTLTNVAVSGVVTNASTGVGVPFARVSVAGDGGSPHLGDAICDYQGRYSITLPAGICLFSFEIPGGEYHLEQIILPAEPTATVNHTIEGYYAQRVYRFFNMKAGTHFYTASDAEFIKVYGTQTKYFTYDGVAYYIELDPKVPGKPLYRFFNKKSGVHFYTMDEAEKARVMKMTSLYTYEGIAYSVRDDGLGMPIYRFYVPARNAHFYTADQSEITRSIKLSNYYRFEGIAYYVGWLRD